MVRGRLEIPLEKSGARGLQKNGARVSPYTTSMTEDILMNLSIIRHDNVPYFVNYESYASSRNFV